VRDQYRKKREEKNFRFPQEAVAEAFFDLDDSLSNANVHPLNPLNLNASVFNCLFFFFFVFPLMLLVQCTAGVYFLLIVVNVVTMLLKRKIELETIV
jgi:hypothetical protein